jgi:hypothetical protein
MAITYTMEENLSMGIVTGDGLATFDHRTSAGFMLVFITVMLFVSSKLPAHAGPLLLQLILCTFCVSCHCLLL